jgi:hypothetical protein
MSRTSTRQPTWQFVLRTMKRVAIIARWYDAEALAKAFVENGVNMNGGDTFLNDIGDYMRSLDRNFYCSGGRPKHDKCAVCDEKIDRDHNGAILADRWIASEQVGHAEIRRVLAAHPMGEKETQTRDLYFFFSKATHPNRDYMARRFLGEGNEFVLGPIGQPSLAMSLDYALETLNLWFWFAASVVFRYRDVLSQSDPELFQMYHDAAEAAGPVAAWLREQFNHVLAEEQGEMRGLGSE